MLVDTSMSFPKLEDQHAIKEERDSNDRDIKEHIIKDIIEQEHSSICQNVVESPAMMEKHAMSDTYILDEKKYSASVIEEICFKTKEECEKEECETGDAPVKNERQSSMLSTTSSTAGSSLYTGYLLLPFYESFFNRCQTQSVCVFTV